MSFKNSIMTHSEKHAPQRSFEFFLKKASIKKKNLKSHNIKAFK